MLRKVAPIEGLKACRKDASLYMCADLRNPILRSPFNVIDDKCYKNYWDGSRQLMDSFGSINDLEREFANMKDDMWIGTIEEIRREIKRLIDNAQLTYA